MTDLAVERSQARRSSRARPRAGTRVARREFDLKQPQRPSARRARSVAALVIPRTASGQRALQALRTRSR